MSETTATYDVKTAETAPDAAIIEEVVARGDLSKLTPEQRVSYYRAVCESLELNPLTKPFEYITLNGRLTLYARKDATDQLRAQRNISITRVERELVDAVVIATAHAETKDGRKDFDIGIVSLEGLRGEAKANAIMKAVTKAKRRVTLSLCGLGFLDETEMVPDAQPVNDTPLPEQEPSELPSAVPARTEMATEAPSNGQIVRQPKPSSDTSDTSGAVDAARRLHFAWLTEHSLSGELLRWLGRSMFGVASRNELTAAQWNTLTKRYHELGVPWLTAAQALWDAIHHESLKDLEGELLAYIPVQFGRQHLWDMTLEELRRSTRAVQRHLENDVASFRAQVLQWSQAVQWSQAEDIPF